MIHRDNLALLAAHLLALPADYERFDMRDYAYNVETCNTLSLKELETQPACGTVACAAGHAPEAGIKPHKGESWSAYVNRTLIDEDLDARAWQWCFGPGWAFYDNTPQGAAKRIQYLLDKGLPVNFIWPEPQCVDLYQ